MAALRLSSRSFDEIRDPFPAPAVHVVQRGPIALQASRPAAAAHEPFQHRRSGVRVAIGLVIEDRAPPVSDRLRRLARRTLVEYGGAVAIQYTPPLAHSRRSRGAGPLLRLALGVPPDPQDFLDEPGGSYDVELGDLSFEHRRPMFAVGPPPCQPRPDARTPGGGYRNA